MKNGTFEGLGRTGGLRRGFTTGTCAAAAAKAAAMMLLSGREISSVEISLPGGGSLHLPLEERSVSPDRARCAVRKDSGDDPDVTDGMLISAEALPGETPGVAISGGPGIGRITRDGLPLPVGEWAINPVPRRMIRESIEPLLPAGKGITIVLSAPDGAERASRTWNPRLGIQGGISILGTTGVVEPKSETAYLASVDLCISSALAFSSSSPGTIFLVPGYVGEKALLEGFSVPREIIVRVGDHVGHALERCAAVRASRVFFFGHVGKVAKLAAGLFNTHCNAGDARLETLAACAGASGADPELIRTLLGLPLAEEAAALMLQRGLKRAFVLVAQRAHRRCVLRMGGKVPLGVAVLSLQGDILGNFPETGEARVPWEKLPSSA